MGKSDHRDLNDCKNRECDGFCHPRTVLSNLQSRHENLIVVWLIVPVGGIIYISDVHPNEKLFAAWLIVP